VNHALTNDPNVFRRARQEKDPTEINMYETIIIDRSGSMGNFASHGSALRESVKAAIIRAKVLEHFKVDFSILFFDDAVESVMDFGEKFSDKRRCSIPSKLMRALERS
jgi:cobalamin biosynthesis protein CobT